jgi:hypothetical protein
MKEYIFKKTTYQIEISEPHDTPRCWTGSDKSLNEVETVRTGNTELDYLFTAGKLFKMWNPQVLQQFAGEAEVRLRACRFYRKRKGGKLHTEHETLATFTLKKVKGGLAKAW